MTKSAFLKNLTLIMCLTILLSVSPILSAQDAKPFVGTWNGNLSVMDQELEIVVEFSIDENGKIQGNIDIPSQGAQDLNLIDITIEEKKISFVIEGVPGDPKFAGELDESGKKIEGIFSQGPAEGTFSIEKTAF